jgi:hypothetical protein
LFQQNKQVINYFPSLKKPIILFSRTIIQKTIQQSGHEKSRSV